MLLHRFKWFAHEGYVWRHTLPGKPGLRETTMPRYHLVGLLAWMFLSSAASTVAEASDCERRDRPVSGENNLWYRSCDTDTVLLFLHGLASDSLDAWSDGTGHYWPSLLTSDPRFEGSSVFLAGYYTDRSCGVYDIRSAAREVYRALHDTPDSEGKSVLDRSNILILAHSMGGVIARGPCTSGRDLTEGT